MYDMVRAPRISFPVLSVCLVLGVMTTISVAWGIVWRLETGQRSATPPVDEPSARLEWPAEVPSSWPPPTRMFRGHAFGRDVVVAHDAVAGADPERGLTVEFTGWPWRALRSTTGFSDGKFFDVPKGLGWTFKSWRAGLVYLSLDRRARLPLIPIWSGLAADTALYAFAWYLLLSTPLPLYRAGRRRFRVSRGMCPACAYDLKGSPSGPCPECGRAG